MTVGRGGPVWRKGYADAEDCFPGDVGERVSVDDLEVWMGAAREQEKC